MFKVALADDTTVFHLTCQRKCFCQMCQQDIKDVNAFGRGFGRYSSEGHGLMMNVLISQEFIVDCGYLKSRARATKVVRS